MEEPELLPRAELLRMAPYSGPRTGRAGKMRLDFNENTVGCSPLVVAALRDRITQEGLAIYPEDNQASSVLADFFEVSQEELLLTNGTDEAIQLLMRTYVDSGQEVILLRPSFAGYRFFAECAGARIKNVDPTGERLDFPLAGLLDAISPSTRAVLIANPNNPTGTAVDLHGITQILERSPAAAILVDEAYFEFCGITALPLIRQYRNLFVCRTFSKAYGLAALRLGCLFSCSGNIRYLRNAQAPFSVNALAAFAAIAATQDPAYVANYVQEVRAALDLLRSGLSTLGIRYAPSAANFLLVFFGDQSHEVCDALRKKGILVRDRSSEIPGAVRVTAGTRQQAGEVLEILRQVLLRHSSG